MMIRLFWMIVMGMALNGYGLPALGTAPDQHARPTLSLDGQWQFQLDPQETGVKSGWHGSEVPFADRIVVPGAWDAQGFGEPTDKLRHNHVGKAWYKRTVAIPAEWAGRRIFVCVGGVHRYADMYLNGRHLGEHVGYLSPFEYEITALGKPGTSVTIAICIDSKQRWDVDALTGCFDIIDEMFTVWGGIWGHVWLEARGPAWLEDLRVTTSIEPTRIACDARLRGDATVAQAAELRIVNAEGRRIAGRSVQIKPGDESVQLAIELPGAALWSPEEPVLYTACLVLTRGGHPVDEICSRFGIRRIETQGWRFLLNGKRLFLRGYGDDAVYPETMAAPSDKEFYIKRLRLIRSYGFNFVRHHSHILPPEYYDAADEAGMLISAEFPIAYEQYYQKAATPAAHDLYRSEWSAAIRRLRNHPSIFDWSMSNEMWGGFPLAADLYRIAKQLDPPRLVIDADGLPPTGFLAGTGDRPTLDFYAVQFNCHALPLDQPNKHHVAGEPRKPVICHETGNYTTFPRPREADAFTHNFKPFWLTPMRPKLEKLGLLGEADRWAEHSEKLYLLSHKMNIEDLRKSPRISGYEWWLFQEYWTGTNGLVNHYFQPKGIAADVVLPFNSSVVVLQDGLAANLRGGRATQVKLLVSNFSPEPLKDANVRWIAKLDGETVGNGTLQPIPIAQGELTAVGDLSIALPDVDSPKRLELRAAISTGALRQHNAWTAHVYPSRIAPPKLNLPLFAAAELTGHLSGYGARPIASAGELDTRAVYVVTQPDLRTLDAAARGACLVCLSPDLVLPYAANRFKPAWWLGNPSDCNLGTVVYDHPLTRDLAPDGWCDAGWYGLIEGSRAYILDDYPIAPQVLIRAIDLHTLCRSKALLYQAKLGQGSIIVCGLNWHFVDKQDRPESEWLLGRLLAHAAAGQTPSVEMPVTWWQRKIEAVPLPNGPTTTGPSDRRLRTGDQPSNRHGITRASKSPDAEFPATRAASHITKN